MTRPLALWERQKGAMRLVAVDAAATGRGLHPGQNLSDARALVPDLETREIDHGCIAHMFGQFADWHSNASPLVAIHADIFPYGDLVLDIAGVSHLFGGETAMLKLLLQRLRTRGFTVHGAIADTVGAAWALAHFRPGIVPPGEQLAALADLPVVALRLADEQVAGLNQLGLKTIGQLHGQPRKSLQAQFGTSLLLRLDQATGLVRERIVPRLPAVEHFADRRFADPIGYMDDVLMTARDLAIRLAIRLQQEQLGAQTFHLFLYRVDHQVIPLAVNAGRPTRDADHIARLFAHRSERLAGEYDPGFGIDMIRLAATSLAPLADTQVGAFETDDGARDLNALYDRISNRLGPHSVTRSKFVDTHIPEQAVRLEPVIARTPDDPAALPDSALPRPLRLLPQPEPINVVAEIPLGPPMRITWRNIGYRILRASGPERIEAEWWRSGRHLELLLPPREDKPLKPGEEKPHVTSLRPYKPSELTRDYYVVEDEGGRRFWVFRLGLYGDDNNPTWFLHGLFP